MPHMLIFGMGYSASRLAARLRALGWRITGVRREAHGEDILAFGDREAVLRAIGAATHILSSVPPARDCRDPVLDQYGAAIGAAHADWTGYLSSTGVYGDSGGAWVDEGTTVGTGRRSARTQADLDWQALRTDMRVFRLPGIYGPGRSAIDRVRKGTAHRIDIAGQVFSRIHVDDIGGAILASLDGPPGVYNIADEFPCSQNRVIEQACALLGLPCPPLLTLEQANLSEAALGFYRENRRVSAMRAQRLLGWRPRYRDYRAGLAACLLAADDCAFNAARPTGERC